MIEGLAYARMFARFPFALRRFLSETLTIERARDIVRTRMEQRESNFLRLVERSVYGHPASPYLDLLKHARCELGDLRTLVMDKGLDAALTALRADGVYVTFEELKGRKPIERNGFSREVAAIDALAGHHAGVAANFPMQLVVPDIEGMHARRAALEEAIGEAAGRGADIEAHAAGGIDSEGVERRFELEAAAADVFFGLQHGHRRVRPHSVARLARAPTVDFHDTSHQRALGFFAGFEQPARNEQRIEARFFGMFGHELAAGRGSRRVNLQR